MPSATSSVRTSIGHVLLGGRIRAVRHGVTRWNQMWRAPSRGQSRATPTGSTDRTPNVLAMRFRAVIFDLGGVVLPSPFDAFRAFERRHGLPHRFVSEIVVAGGETGAW